MSLMFFKMKFTYHFKAQIYRRIKTAPYCLYRHDDKRGVKLCHYYTEVILFNALST